MKELLVDAGVPTAAHGTFDAVEPAVGLPARRCRRPLRGQDRRPGRRQGRARHRRRWPRPSTTSRDKLSGASFGAAGRPVVIEEGLTGPELSVHGHLRRPAGRGRWRRPRTSSASATATRGPNTGGMGAYSPVSQVDDELVGDGDGHGHRADPGRPARPGHRLPGRALRRDHAHRRRARRCSSSTSASATPRPRWCCPAGTATSPTLLAAAADGVAAGGPDVRGRTPRWRVVAAAEGYPASPRTGDADRRARGGRGHRRGRRSTPPAWRRDTRDRLVTAGGRVLGVTGAGARHRQGPGPGLPGHRGHQLAGDDLPPRHRRDDRRMPTMKVAVLMGSTNDQERMAPALEHPGRVRGRGQRARDVGPPHPRGGRRLRPGRPRRRLRRAHLRRRHGRPPGRGGRRPTPPSR